MARGAGLSNVFVTGLPFALLVIPLLAVAELLSLTLQRDQRICIIPGSIAPEIRSSSG
jgi:hypothetical protein